MQNYDSKNGKDMVVLDPKVAGSIDRVVNVSACGEDNSLENLKQVLRDQGYDPQAIDNAFRSLEIAQSSSRALNLAAQRGQEFEAALISMYDTLTANVPAQGLEFKSQAREKTSFVLNPLTVDTRDDEKSTTKISLEDFFDLSYDISPEMVIVTCESRAKHLIKYLPDASGNHLYSAERHVPLFRIELHKTPAQKKLFKAVPAQYDIEMSILPQGIEEGLYYSGSVPGIMAEVDSTWDQQFWGIRSVHRPWEKTTPQGLFKDIAANPEAPKYKPLLQKLAQVPGDALEKLRETLQAQVDLFDSVRFQKP